MWSGMTKTREIGKSYTKNTAEVGRERSFANDAIAEFFGDNAHEMAHTWFQFLLATNEVKHYWMDEGFTEYFGELAGSHILNYSFKLINAITKSDERVFQIELAGKN